MVIFASLIAVQNPNTKQVFIVQRDYELSSVGMLLKNDTKNSFKFLVRQSFPCIAKNTRNSVVHQDKVCHIQMSNKPVAAYAFVDNGYLERVIFAYLKKILNIFFDAMGDKWQTFTQDESLNIEKVTAEFQRYQIVKNVDKLAETQAQVDATKIVLHESIRKLLENQGDLDKLVEKSKDLSEHAKQFYKTSKKMDKSCCAII